LQHRHEGAGDDEHRAAHGKGAHQRPVVVEGGADVAGADVGGDSEVDGGGIGGVQGDDGIGDGGRIVRPQRRHETVARHQAGPALPAVDHRHGHGLTASRTGRRRPFPPSHPACTV
jgi:hypothetical protein